MGLDWLTVVFESPPDSDRQCRRSALSWMISPGTWRHVPGVMSIDSYSNQLRIYNEGYNEGNPKMSVVPIDPGNYGALNTEIGRLRGYMNKDCTMVAAHFYLTDHKATTINGVIKAVKEFRRRTIWKGSRYGWRRATRGCWRRSTTRWRRASFPMMLSVYAAILLLVFLAYRDLRAMIACCLPLTVGTFIGYWFMKELKIGLTVATLPVMVLAVGSAWIMPFTSITDCSFTWPGVIRSSQAMEHALPSRRWRPSSRRSPWQSVWSPGRSRRSSSRRTWAKLLAFMFIVNLIMAMTALPALAVVLERLFPRKSPVYVSELLSHPTQNDERDNGEDRMRKNVYRAGIQGFLQPGALRASPARPVPGGCPPPPGHGCRTRLPEVSAGGGHHGGDQGDDARLGPGGKRIVAVGDHGIVLLSDNDGADFRQAKSVPVRSTLTAVCFVDDKTGGRWGIGAWFCGPTTRARTGRSSAPTQRWTSRSSRSASRTGARLCGRALVPADLNRTGGRPGPRSICRPRPGGKSGPQPAQDLREQQGDPFRGGGAGDDSESYDGENWSYVDTGYKGSFWTGIALNNGTLLVGGLRGRSTGAPTTGGRGGRRSRG